tara:strand:+ start:591 stop:1487 length:897 start_codon:yes stop_codon:yes gene_type:complete
MPSVLNITILYMLKILIAGANGQLGKSFLYWSSKFKNFKFSFTDIPELDLTKISDIENYLKENLTHYVINCAAYTNVDNAELEVQRAEELNVGVVNNLCKLSKKYNFRLIHFSTDYVFDGMKNQPYIETDEFSPINVYGKTKAKGELLILDSNINAWIIRTSWLFSPYGNNFATNIFSKLQGEKKINVINDQLGSPTYAIDLAKITLNAIKSERTIEGVKTYHIANKVISSWYNLALKIKKEMKSECLVNPIKSSGYPNLAKRPKYSVLNCDKIKKDFNFDIRSWELGVEHCIRQILN